MIYSCIHTSLATTFIHSYKFDQLQAGLIYLPFGIGAIISTAVSAKWIDHDYRVVAKAYGLPINKVAGDDLLHFPIEEARMRSVFIPTFLALFAVLAYGWLVDKHMVSWIIGMLPEVGSKIVNQRSTARCGTPCLPLCSWVCHTNMFQCVSCRPILSGLRLIT